MTIGSNILFFRNLPSTNSYAAALLREKSLADGTIIRTNFQSAGKGHAGNTWESEDGKNLLFSIILHPSFISPTDQFYISMALSLGICDFLKNIIPGCSVKWPNDIYVKNDKIAGILIESSIIADKIETAVAGIGLNINQHIFRSKAPNPVSLSQITGSTYDLGNTLDQLIKCLDNRYKELEEGKLVGIKSDYISSLYRLNEWCVFRDVKDVFTGRILTIGDFGSLVIERPDLGLREYAFKEIEFML
jgi:BirA family transcriptional regulator, biotin operon repressor / biotin---[acetyl-CoA-carboxylase] ligase